MIPEISRESLLDALKRFDLEERDQPEWQGWETWRTHKYAIRHGEHLYPVNEIISLATGTPVSGFSGGTEANNYVQVRGFTVELLRPDEGVSERISDILDTVAYIRE